jgi:hypothetical protein
MLSLWKPIAVSGSFLLSYQLEVESRVLGFFRLCSCHDKAASEGFVSGRCSGRDSPQPTVILTLGKGRFADRCVSWPHVGAQS